MNYDEQALQAVRERRFLLNGFDAWLYEEFEPHLGKRVFEIGCGLGNLSSNFLDREQVVSIDIDEGSVVEVNKKYADRPNFHAFQYSITDPAVLELARYNLDTGISLNVLEHIEDDQLALQHIYQILAKDASLILIIPAHDWLYGTMDSSIGHYRRYTKASLAKKLEKAGFEVVRQKYINGLGALGWFFAGRVLKAQVPPVGQLKTMNALIPTVRWFETNIGAGFGISLFTVARKR